MMMLMLCDRGSVTINLFAFRVIILLYELDWTGRQAGGCRWGGGEERKGETDWIGYLISVPRVQSLLVDCSDPLAASPQRWRSSTGLLHLYFTNPSESDELAADLCPLLLPLSQRLIRISLSLCPPQRFFLLAACCTCEVRLKLEDLFARSLLLLLPRVECIKMFHFAVGVLTRPLSIAVFLSLPQQRQPVNKMKEQQSREEVEREIRFIRGTWFITAFRRIISG